MHGEETNFLHEAVPVAPGPSGSIQCSIGDICMNLLEYVGLLVMYL